MTKPRFYQGIFLIIAALGFLANRHDYFLFSVGVFHAWLIAEYLKT